MAGHTAARAGVKPFLMAGRAFFVQGILVGKHIAKGLFRASGQAVMTNAAVHRFWFDVRLVVAIRAGGSVLLRVVRMAPFDLAHVRVMTGHTGFFIREGGRMFCDEGFVQRAPMAQAALRDLLFRRGTFMMAARTGNVVFFRMLFVIKNNTAAWIFHKNAGGNLFCPRRHEIAGKRYAARRKREKKDVQIASHREPRT